MRAQPRKPGAGLAASSEMRDVMIVSATLILGFFLGVTWSHHSAGQTSSDLSHSSEWTARKEAVRVPAVALAQPTGMAGREPTRNGMGRWGMGMMGRNMGGGMGGPKVGDKAMGKLQPGDPQAQRGFVPSPLVPERLLPASAAERLRSCMEAGFKPHVKRAGGAKFVILQSTDFRSKTNMSISFMFNRQAWANAFGHIFTLRPMPHTVANKGYRATASSKPKIILQEVQHYIAQHKAGRDRDVEWVVWMDADTMVNQDDPPVLTELIQSAGNDKMLLGTQGEYLNSGVMFARVDSRTVPVLNEWIQIMDSGVIGCHPWDQAGLQWMVANRLTGMPITTPCQPPGCGTSGKFWSCTPKFESEVEKRYGTNRAVQCGVANNDTGPIGVVLDRDNDTILHCWACFSEDLCDHPNRQPAHVKLVHDKKRCTHQAGANLRQNHVLCKPRQATNQGGGQKYDMVPYWPAKTFQITHGDKAALEFNYRYAECISPGHPKKAAI